MPNKKPPYFTIPKGPTEGNFSNLLKPETNGEMLARIHADLRDIYARTRRQGFVVIRGGKK